MSEVDRSSDCRQRFGSDRDAMDRCFMAEALALARGVAGRTWPNPPVGAIVVKDGRVVGRGAHQGAGQPHAEPVALAEAGSAARGATLYVTLEPCNHQGRTAPCAPAVAESGVTRVVVGMRDPNPAVIGGGCRFLRDRSIEVKSGVLAEECLELVWPFATTGNFTRVYVELKTAVSLDGRFAPPALAGRAPEPIYLTGPLARHDVHRRRRRVDLVLVGKGTVLADRPRLDGRLAKDDADVPAAEPQAGYVDTRLEYTGGLDRDAYLVFAGESARGSASIPVIEADGGTIIFCRQKNGRVDPRSIMEQAAMRDIYTIMIEGGPRLADSFLSEQLVDRWVQYLAPVAMGAGIGWPDRPATGKLPAMDFSLTRTEQMGKDLLIVHDRRKFRAVLGQVTI
jgi:diaminohydroxyphosphoribosylaminopyrimidine deaminase/5-amino-6-(5-phosphoribosylamino)uracil reductase